MGSLGLDLSSSRAKVARAREHLELLNAKVSSLLDDRKPCTLALGQIDPKTGWAAITLACHDFDSEHVGVYVGDVIHNLRCALDYITASLAIASGAQIEKQQFPVEDDPAIYASKYESVTTPNKKALFLKGITHGLREIEGLQPYKRQGDPHADPLWHVHRLSNADKHREITVFAAPPERANMVYEPSPVEIEDFPPPDWEPNLEHVVRRIRYTRPYPPYVHFKRKITCQIVFTTSPRGTETVPFAVSPADLSTCCDHVSMIVDLFEAL